MRPWLVVICFNSRTPCGVRRLVLTLAEEVTTFQFTHPVWGATCLRQADGSIIGSFNSRTPCGVRQAVGVACLGYRGVSIHAPRVGCDYADELPSADFEGFNSRTPCGVRLRADIRTIDEQRFNSRTPCGVRLHELLDKDLLAPFQFTHPVWGATDTVEINSLLPRVSIHAPRVGCDNVTNLYSGYFQCFNSRTPCGVRRLNQFLSLPQYIGFNSRTPCGVRPRCPKVRIS